MNRSKPTRSFLACVCAILVASSVFVPVAAATEDPLMFNAIPAYTIYGGGWGHGIGMSQYGAEGYSTVKGWDAERIIEHYFQQTDVRTLESLGKAANPIVSVNIDSDYSGSYTGRSYWNLQGHGSVLEVTDGTDTIQLAADTYHTLRGGSGDIYVDTDKDGSMDGGEPRFESPVDVRALTGSPALVVVGGESGPFDQERIAYRETLEIAVVPGSTWRISATNVLRLERYLYGVVPREMPASWSSEALKAQSIAARSYAWASNPEVGGELPGTLYCTTASQVYNGAGRLSGGVIVDHETALEEVQATAGQVAYHAASSTIVQTFFSSSMGGFTANIEDVWTGATPQPYYTGVSDAYDYVHANPYAQWTRSFNGLGVAGALASSSYTWAPPGAGTSVWVTDLEIERGPSGYPKWTTFTFSNGSTTKESSWDVRQALSLPSPNFLFAFVPIERYAGTDRYETAVAIAEEAYPDTAPAAVVARGDDFADALVGSAVAGAAGGPLLLSARDSLSSSTLAKLEELAPTTVYVMGGHGVLSAAVDAAIESRLPGATVVRVAGANRYETAAAAAALVRSLGGGDEAILASGTSWPDAAGASALAFGRTYPILLTRRDALPGATRAALEGLADVDLIIVGGDGVVSADVRAEAKAAAGGALEWLRDSDRYGTSAAVARYCVQTEGFDMATLYLATGETYADALTGGVLAGLQGHPLTLTASDRIKPGTGSLLAQYSDTIETLGVFGGPGAVGAGCLDDAQLILAD